MAERPDLESRVTALEARIEEVAADELAAGQEQIVGLLTTVIDQPGDSG